MGILRTALKKLEALMAESEDHLEESQMREEEARQEDWGWSNSSEGEDGDVVVEGAEGSGPAGVEDVGPLRSQQTEPSMEVDVGDIPLLTSKDATTVTPKEDEMLTDDPTSVAREMAWLQVTTLTAISPRMVRPRNMSRPPPCVKKVLHMSPLHSLRGRKKKEEGRP